MSTIHCVKYGGAVAQWLDRATDDRDVASSNATGATMNMGKFFTPHCVCLSTETSKAVGPFYLVSMPEEVKYATRR